MNNYRRHENTKNLFKLQPSTKTNKENASLHSSSPFNGRWLIIILIIREKYIHKTHTHAHNVFQPWVICYTIPLDSISWIFVIVKVPKRLGSVLGRSQVLKNCYQIWCHFKVKNILIVVYRSQMLPLNFKPNLKPKHRYVAKLLLNKLTC